MQAAKELRSRILAVRDSLRPDSRLQRSESIARRLGAVPLFLKASLVLVYMSRGSEVETGPVRCLARERGMKLAVPRCVPSTHSLHFHLLDEREILEPGPYNIPQPPEASPRAEIGPGALVLVPGSVFDRCGNRLGMGGGYYDRWLSAEGRGLPVLGLAFHEQLVGNVPVGPFDVPVHWLVTDRESFACDPLS